MQDNSPPAPAAALGEALRAFAPMDAQTLATS
jgi:hypothetical protein